MIAKLKPIPHQQVYEKSLQVDSAVGKSLHFNKDLLNKLYLETVQTSIIHFEIV